MNERIREQIRAFVHEDLLHEFESLTEEVDGLKEELEGETDKAKAWTLAVRWSTSMLTLARMESTLLSGVMPLIEESFVETSDEIAQIRQQQAEADQMVYELRRGPGARPLDPEREARYHAEVEEAKAKRNEILVRLGERLRELVRVNGPARVAKSQVGLSLRALRAFINMKFPQPTVPRLYRGMGGPAPLDLSKDPIEAFADQWVTNMGKPKPKYVSARQDRKPQRDWDEERRKHRQMMRERTLETQA